MKIFIWIIISSSEVENELDAHVEDMVKNEIGLNYFCPINLRYFDKSDGSKFASVMSIK